MITALTQSETYQIAGEIEGTDGPLTPHFCPSLKWIETATQVFYFVIYTHLRWMDEN